ncbi:Alpha/Beta hydrolase protein [Amylocystis lapponica]|nr:Alpha/Beta hydrolase protein [Amylocystis lapponica]
MSAGYPSHETVQLPSGTRLEYILSPPLLSQYSQPSSGNKLAVCLHPWSWLGGRMDDPVLHTLAGPLREQGYHVLRYNSRGVGKSSGWASLTGFSEARDLAEMARWAVDTIRSVTSVAIVGYSHGSLIASQFAVMLGVRTSHVLLSYPLGPRHWLTAFQGKTYTATLRALIKSRDAHVLVLYGDQDEFTPVESYDVWAATLQDEANDAEGSLQVVKVEGGTHFWRAPAQAERIVEEIVQWVQ